MSKKALDHIFGPAASPSESVRLKALDHQAMLTKPPGALGRLEDIAVQLAAMQDRPQPEINKIHISVFAADHGIASEGVSAFPQDVTMQMVKNFASGGAAINILADQINADLEIVNMGTLRDTSDLLHHVTDSWLGPGTKNFLKEPAMSTQLALLAMVDGRACVERAQKAGCDLFIGGEMGIGNTTSATALACALLDKPPELLTGPGTGLDRYGIYHKVRIIKQALELHGPYLDQPLDILARLGGFEIAALVGSYMSCAEKKMPVLVDGFICSIAALVAHRMRPGAQKYFLYAHHSAEPGHALVLDALEAKPLLDLGMRLGEGSGAAVAVPLLRAACALHNEMATFETAGISGKQK